MKVTLSKIDRIYNFENKKLFFSLFIFTFVIKLILCYYISYNIKCSLKEYNFPTIIAIPWGDTGTYFEPIDNFLEKGEYYREFKNKYYKGKIGDFYYYTGRGPYYGVIYFLFRIFFPKYVSYDLVVLFQIILESLSVIYLSLLSFRILNNKIAFFVTYFLYLFNFSTTFWSILLMTESLSVSFLIFSIYYFYDYLKNKKIKSFILSSIYMSFVVLLKPYFGLIYIFIGIAFFFERSLSFKVILRKLFVYFLPLIVLSAPYTVRNYIRFGIFKPFSDPGGGYLYTDAHLTYRDFVKSWGGCFVNFDPKCAGCYFEFTNEKCDFTLPKYAICKGYSINDVIKVRELYIRFQKNPSKQLEDSVVKSFNNLINLYKQNCPFNYHVLSRIRLLKETLIHSGSYYLPIRKDLKCYKDYQILIKLYQSFLYYLVLIFGFIGLLLLIKKDIRNFIIISIPIYLILFFPLGIRSTEARYFNVPSHPILIIGVTYIILILIKQFGNKTKNQYV